MKDRMSDGMLEQFRILFEGDIGPSGEMIKEINQAREAENMWEHIANQASARVNQLEKENAVLKRKLNE